MSRNRGPSPARGRPTTCRQTDARYRGRAADDLRKSVPGYDPDRRIGEASLADARVQIGLRTSRAESTSQGTSITLTAIRYPELHSVMPESQTYPKGPAVATNALASHDGTNKR
jgi:hypothetical protein